MTASAFCAAAVRFGREHKVAERDSYEAALAARSAADGLETNPALSLCKQNSP